MYETITTTGRTLLTEDEKLEHKHSLVNDTPAVYVGTYRKYNNGSLNGMWVDISSFDSHREFIEFCLNLHADEDDPELMFQDYVNFPRELYSENCLDEDAFKQIKWYAEQPRVMRAAIKDFIEEFGAEDIESFENRYEGDFSSEEDCARQLVDTNFNLDEMLGDLAGYFDYKRYSEMLFSTTCAFRNGRVFRRNS